MWTRLQVPYSQLTYSAPFSLGPSRVTTDHIGDHQDPTTETPQGASDFVDGSGPIFSMYLEMATEEDKKMVEGWKADADGILIFVCLYLLLSCLVPTH